jgi:SAM-dependent methyltransferase
MKMFVPADRYYISRPCSEGSGFGSRYWCKAIDPDGNTRNLCSPEERIRHLANLNEELEYMNSLDTGRVLDVGCGVGHFLSGLNDRWEKHGVDICEFAAEHAAPEGEIFCGTLMDANYPDNHFDAILCHHVIEHVANPIPLIRELHRVLKPISGKLILSTPDFDSACARRFGKNYRLLHDPTHITLFSYESLLRCVSDLNFTLEEVRFPFFDTPYFTEENMLRMFDTTQISPPFYGNFMSFYLSRK